TTMTNAVCRLMREFAPAMLLLKSLAPRLLAARQESAKVFSASFAMTSHLGKGHRNDRSLAACWAVEPTRQGCTRSRHARRRRHRSCREQRCGGFASAIASQKHTVSYSSQVLLPFTHLDEPWG